MPDDGALELLDFFVNVPFWSALTLTLNQWVWPPTSEDLYCERRLRYSDNEFTESSFVLVLAWTLIHHSLPVKPFRNLTLGGNRRDMKNLTLG
jgi:hypothetical protein